MSTRKLVHKQFNSPIGLYSQQNVKETLNRELKAFGSDGIEIDEQISKPLNLANSAVLRAVEEEDQQLKCGYKRVAWPPVSEERIVREFTPQPAATAAPASGAAVQQPLYNNVQQQQQQYYNYQHEAQQQQQEKYIPQTVRAASIAGYSPQQQQQQQQQYQIEEPIQYKQAQFQRYAQQQHEEQQYREENEQSRERQQQQHHQFGWKPIQRPVAKPQNQYHTQICSQILPQPEQYRSSSYDNYHQPQQQQQYQPVYQQQQQSGRAQQQYQPPTAPQYQPQVQPAYNNNNSQQYQQPQQQPNYQSHQYNTQQNQANQSSYNSYSQFQQQHQQPRAQSLSQDQVDQTPYVAQALPQDYRGGSPGIIQLRKEAPVNQKPAPVYTSQPAAVSFQGGSNMRGDLKWPPPEYKEAAAKENEERRQLALGPVCRPRKVHRDYSSFFAKNAINSYYPSYKVPPGTQHMLA